MRVLISAGEASGDLYASRVVAALKARHPDAEFFGCAGPRMQAAGVRAIVDSRALADYFCEMSRLKIEALFRDVHDNRDVEGYRVAQQVLAGEFNWLQDGIVG